MGINHKTRNNLFRAVFLVCLVVCGVITGISHADIVVVARKGQQAHRELIRSLLSSLSPGDVEHISVVHSKEFTHTVLSNGWKRQYDLVIAVGTDVTLEIVALKLDTPVYSVAIPKISFDELYRRRTEVISNRQENDLSAIYLDQPLTRRFDLIKLLLPDTKKVGVVLGPGTLSFEDDIESEAKRHKLKLQIGKVTDEKYLVDTLDSVLINSDVMLGLVDPLVFSRASARNILLTTYRWRVPLIGISPAYVRSGALASVHSTPDQIGKQLAEVVEEFVSNSRKKLPDPQYPKYFSVSVNYQVAESMGLHIADEDILQKVLLDTEGSDR